MNCKNCVFSRTGKIKDTLFLSSLLRLSYSLSIMWEERWFKSFSSSIKGFYWFWVEDLVKYVLTLSYGVR